MTSVAIMYDQAAALVGQIEYPAKVQGGEAFFVVKDPENGKKQGMSVQLTALDVVSACSGAICESLCPYSWL